MKITSTLQNLMFPQQHCWILNPTRMWQCIMKWVLSDRACNFTKKQLLDQEDEGTAVVWSTGNYSHTDTAPHPTRPETSASPLYEVLRFSGWWVIQLVAWNMVPWQLQSGKGRQHVH
jgi:hypothetical protein